MGYPPPPAGAPPSSRRRRTGVIVAGVAIALAAVVVLALLLTGVVPSPLHPAGSNSSSPDLSFDQARSIAENDAAATAGGPWTVLAGAGLALWHSTAFWGVNNSGDDDCGGNPSSTLYYPSDQAGVGSGLSPLWVVELTNYRGEALNVFVINASVAYSSSYSTNPGEGGVSCGSLGGSTGLNGTLVDSTEAAQVAGENGGSTFLQDHPTADVEFVLLNVGTEETGVEGVSGAIWEVLYDDCPIFENEAAAGGGEAVAAVNATTGDFITEETVSTSCEGTTPTTDVVLAQTSASTCTTSLGSTLYTYDVAIESVSEALDTEELGMEVVNITGELLTPGLAEISNPGTCPAAYPSTSGWVADLVDLEGSTVAYYDETGWEPLDGSVMPLSVTSGETLEISSTSPLTVATLDLFGEDGDSVTGETTL